MTEMQDSQFGDHDIDSDTRTLNTRLLREKMRKQEESGETKTTKLLGDLVVEDKKLTPQLRDYYLRVAQTTGKRFGRVLVEFNIMTTGELAEMLARHRNLRYVDETQMSRLAKKIDIKLYQDIMQALENDPTVKKTSGISLFLPVRERDDRILLIEEGTDDSRASSILKGLQIEYETAIASSTALNDHVNQLNVKRTEAKIEQMIQRNSWEKDAHKLLDLFIQYAIIKNCADIHFEPRLGDLTCRFRIDGVLKNLWSLDMNLAKRFQEAIRRYVKDIEGKKKESSVEGSFPFHYGGETYNIRVSIMKGVRGPDIDLRILYGNLNFSSLKGIDFSPKAYNLIYQALKQSNGIVLLSGPTGSGKTTTLYAMLNELYNVIHDGLVKVVTIENPVESQLPYALQCEVTKDNTFAVLSKESLRHDPDIMLIGEIRDEETAANAFRCAYTGHLCLSTVHANDSVATIDRLIDLGVSSVFLSSLVRAVVAQRLVRMVCSKCKQKAEYAPEDFHPEVAGLIEQLEKNENGKVEFFKGKGCERCDYTGYKGRRVVAEVLTINKSLNRAIKAGDTEALERHLIEDPHSETLSEDVMRFIIEGLTSVEEGTRVKGDLYYEGRGQIEKNIRQLHQQNQTREHRIITD